MKIDKSKIAQDIAYFLSVNDLPEVSCLAKTLEPGEVSSLLETLPRGQRKVFWNYFVVDQAKGEVFTRLSKEVLTGIIEITGKATLISALDSMDIEDLAGIFDYLPEQIKQQIKKIKPLNERALLNRVLNYREDQTGSFLCLNVLTSQEEGKIADILSMLRERESVPDNTTSVYVLGGGKDYLGHIPLQKLIIANPSSPIQEHIQKDILVVMDTDPISEVTKAFEELEPISLPVVDSSNRLLGRVSVAEVLDAIRKEASKERQGTTGVSGEEDLFGPVLRTSKNRSLWLGINLLTTFLVAWSLNFFKGTLEQNIILTALFPIVASMGGIGGNQTITLVIRGLAMQHINKTNISTLLLKELMVGLINGCIWALVVSLCVLFWFGNSEVAFVLGFAMIVNLSFAALSGVAIPMFLKYLRIDPALAGNVILTTITDVLGIFVFLGLATFLVV